MQVSRAYAFHFDRQPPPLYQIHSLRFYFYISFFHHSYSFSFCNFCQNHRFRWHGGTFKTGEGAKIAQKYKWWNISFLYFNFFSLMRAWISLFLEGGKRGRIESGDEHKFYWRANFLCLKEVQYLFKKSLYFSRSTQWNFVNMRINVIIAHRKVWNVLLYVVVVKQLKVTKFLGRVRLFLERIFQKADINDF